VRRKPRGAEAEGAEVSATAEEDADLEQLI